MKQLLTFLALIFSYMLCGAQASSLTVDNQTPGWLSSKIGYGEQQTVENLKVNGYLNPDDLKFIGTLINNQKLGGHIDLEGSQIVDENGTLTNQLKSNCFAISYSVVNPVIRKISLPINLSSTSSCFSSYISIDTLVVGGPSMKVIGERFFSNKRGSNGNIRHLIIREGVEEIEQYAFYKSNNYSRNYENAVTSETIQNEMPILESVKFPESLKIVGKGAFDWCINLKQMNLPNTVESIGNFAFSMTGVQPDTLLLPNKLEQYNTTSFALKNGQTVIIPSSVKKIDNTYQTYYNMTNTWTTWDYISSSNQYIWVINNTTPPSVKYRYEGFLKGATIYIPKDSYANYSSKAPFSFAKLIEVIPIEEISFNIETQNIYVNDVLSVKPIILPSNASNKNLIWSSSNPEVASINPVGEIHALRYGQCMITATTENGGKTASFKLNVYEHVTDIILPTSVSVNINEKTQLIPEIRPIGKTDGLISWNSSDTDIATVDDSGMIKGISKGDCLITVSANDGGLSASCTVTVIQPVESVNITPKSLSLKVGDHNQLAATILPSNANDKSIIWSSTDESIVQVNSNGYVTGIAAGKAQIKATSNFNNELYDICEVTVLQPATGISLDKSEVEIIEDESIQIVASVLPENASNKNVNWTSSDISIVMVSSDGTVYAMKPGQATIVATTVDGGFVALCKVTVKAKTVLASNIVLSNNSETIAVGETLQLSATVLPDNTTNKVVNWTSTNTQVATVNASGLVTAIAEGKTQVIATTADGSNLSAICEIAVEKQFVNITKIEITPAYARIAIGNTVALSAIVSPGNATNQVITWSSTNPSVATVSELGEVTAIAEGEAIIIASTQDGSNLSATCQISIYTETIFVESIVLNPSKINGAVEDTYQIEVTILPNNATNKTLSWNSSDESVASVENGLVRLKALGTAIITAAAIDGSNIKSECAIVVSHEASFDEIIADKNNFVKIFNLSGFLIYEGIYADAILTPGYYIIICNGSSVKTRID